MGKTRQSICNEVVLRPGVFRWISLSMKKAISKVVDSLELQSSNGKELLVTAVIAAGATPSQ